MFKLNPLPCALCGNTHYYPYIITCGHNNKCEYCIQDLLYKTGACQECKTPITAIELDRGAAHALGYDPQCVALNFNMTIISTDIPESPHDRPRARKINIRDWFVCKYAEDESFRKQVGSSDAISLSLKKYEISNRTQYEWSCEARFIWYLILSDVDKDIYRKMRDTECAKYNKH